MAISDDIISEFGDPVPLVVNRDDQPEHILDGKVIPATRRQIKVTAVIQPMRGAEILMFEEGDRIRQSVKIYTEDQLLIIDEVKKTKADEVVWNDTAFEIVSVEKWNDSGDDGLFTYYKSIGRRKDRG